LPVSVGSLQRTLTKASAILSEPPFASTTVEQACKDALCEYVKRERASWACELSLLTPATTLRQPTT
jgi:hypothetical protein